MSDVAVPRIGRLLLHDRAGDFGEATCSPDGRRPESRAFCEPLDHLLANLLGRALYAVRVVLQPSSTFEQGPGLAMASTRRLAAILAADVAGYSRLMGADEEGTHERLKAHFRELVDPKIADHYGRMVKNTGDRFWRSSPVSSTRYAARSRSNAA